MLRLIHYISVFPLFILLFSCAGRVVEADKASTYFEKGVAFEDKICSIRRPFIICLQLAAWIPVEYQTLMLWGLTIIGLLCCFLKAI